MIESISLNSYWKFKTDADDLGRSQLWYLAAPADTEDIRVPSCWNELRESLYHYEGVAWYFKKFMFRKSAGIERNVLFFYGVNYQCEVWINGKLAGAHTGGFTPFEVDAMGLLIDGSENLLVLRVDSTIGTMTSPPIGVDWFNYGGIFREVWLNGTGESWLDDVTILTAMSGSITIKSCIGSFDGASQYSLDIGIFDREALTQVHTSTERISGSAEAFTVRLPSPSFGRLSPLSCMNSSSH